MAAKRALVVDDSRSARVILSRMLEVHGLQVDMAESGEQALDYLQEKRPDVVFMDHLMPGMDGFEAVKAIKRDSRTAAIPVMMYTSQEGEAYVSEARSLGAAGVLSKTLMPSDVARALYQLKLLPDRRDLNPAASAQPSRGPLPDYRPTYAAQPATSQTHAMPPPPTHSSSMQPTMGSPSRGELSRDQLGELRRSLEVSLEHAARRIGNELRSSIQLPPQLPESVTARPKTPRALIAALVVFALVPMLVSAVLLWNIFQTGKLQLDQANARLGIVVAEQLAQIEALRAELRKRGDQPANDPQSKRTEILPVPYGEAPLVGPRAEQIKKIADRLQAEGFKGRVQVEYFTGDFCLMRSGAGFALASADMPQKKCELIGNPYDDALTVGQRQSAEYVATINSVGQSTRGSIQVTTINGGRKPSVAYPPQSDLLTAGAWNQVAMRNHRIEITTDPTDPLAAKKNQ